MSSSASALGLSNDELKVVEQSRQRLYQLTNSIGGLRSKVLQSNPLPPLQELQNQADVLQNNIASVLQVLSKNHDLFTRLAVHPSTNYPGRIQEGLLMGLLRKKPEPEVEAAMNEGRKTYGDMADGEGFEALSGRWGKVRNYMIDRLEPFMKEEQLDPYTTEEREMGVENVRTGLRRELEEFESDSEEDDEDEDEEEGGNNKGRNVSQAADDDDPDIIMLDRPPPPLPMEGTGWLAGCFLARVAKT
ncbi:mediator of RNA polymerase II transcription complex subunit 8-domain-containing protein [Pseudomassariella vexata]|uniref:Mediator of RNA polymerase II transcription subunit 8 n=1 Tax=Pseudomassariella vexata TaxID=1141098 RepID=A0A1Y2DDF3_9PEZI|nr:mediator of RNA polymerase II transcription complex subunit 8-domain-containing protein [Pseudomassariella vexata]ORY57146.1 mediator of RNA polymerase II transcription complex subunit 8-domain-containing protein [Pseudomassariella vexata]